MSGVRCTVKLLVAFLRLVRYGQGDKASCYNAYGVLHLFGIAYSVRGFGISLYPTRLEMLINLIPPTCLPIPKQKERGVKVTPLLA